MFGLFSCVVFFYENYYVEFRLHHRHTQHKFTSKTERQTKFDANKNNKMNIYIFCLHRARPTSEWTVKFFLFGATKFQQHKIDEI